jgi:hypothetical protein
MPATPITLATRYFPTGTTKYYWLPSCSDPDNPTRGELNAGTDLSPDLAAVSGWKTTSAQIDTPAIVARFTGKIPGRITADDSSIEMYADLAGTDARTLMPRDTAGFIARLDGGDVAARKMDIFPVTVSATPKDMGTDDKAATITFEFSITSEPSENVAIPA